MYIVRNLTRNTVILSDLRAEIGPRKIIDLERVARRSDIDNSFDLKAALTSKRLQMIKSSVVQSQETVVHEHKHQVTEKIIERDKLEDEKLVELLRQVVAEEIPKHQQPVPAPPQTDVNEVAAALGGKLDSMMEDLRNQLRNYKPTHGSTAADDSPSIDPKKLAELSEKPIQRITENLQTNNVKKSRKITIKNDRSLDDLANELDL